MGLQHAEARLHDDFPQAASLLAEIERLKREVAVARARIGELEARADIDPLLDILNRRGFERDLKRAIAYVKRYGTQAALMFIDLDGFKVIIAGAGGSAHLPGMTASMTPLPVFGVPMNTHTLEGKDSLLSIMQMPGGIPVGTLAIGKAGATNA
ncbi:MAG: AIR carboxylase family protein, partial [Pseudolabrys sp.]